MNTRSQRGVTTVSLIVIIALASLILLNIFRALPMYMDFSNVKSVMEAVANDAEVDPRSKAAMWASLGKRLRINQISYIKKENFTFTRQDDVTTMTVDYEVRKPYVADMFIGAHFVHSVEIKR
ncbi:MAG: DUF4845 domain-containing protein [Gammaproteobacteria bacterium]|nr:DUF4845 domain-containing protein [Gammaproteobacteria bacterium]